MNKTYTDEQVQWLINNYYDATWEDIFSHFPFKSKGSIQQLASKYGIKRNRNNPVLKNTEDIIGKRFGRLVVINYIGYNKYKRHIYLCKCDCGNYKEITRHSLEYNITKSCGCLKNEQIIALNKKDTNYEKHHIRAIRKSIHSSAKQRGYNFELSYDDVKDLITKPCYYCGCEHSNSHRSSSNEKEYGIFYYNGIDRIDSNKGYEKDNVVTCCKTCNIAKSTMTQEEFYNWIQLISKHYTKDKIACA